VLLAEQLFQLDIELKVIELADFAQQVSYFYELNEQQNISLIVNQELEINERARDKNIAELGINLIAYEADVIVPKGKVLNLSGQMFKVFTPFKKAWLTFVKQQGFDYLFKPTLDESKTFEQSELLDTLYLDNSSAAWPLVDVYEQQVLPDFLNDKVEHYQENRDFPSLKATSGASPYLAIGALSPRYLMALLVNRFPDILVANDSPNFAWLNELIWREFYRHLLHHQPALCKHQMFNEKYKDTVWPFDQALFDAWCQGKTGYPIVDAAMRQLNQTGWMHNRLRMVVASFLTKHLLIDWRHGEKYFMQHLIDGDLAANNGGWQWAASTGCDAQPYFRIFNPIRQSERFDPQGDFIRKYIPELEGAPNKDIHFPHKWLNGALMASYWPAIVDHKTAREQALAFYR
jgi:deoxyribodipyrimidine photo-lyase